MLNKGIESGKEHRRHYRGSKAFCYACANHRSCSYCNDGRQIQKRRAEQDAEQELKWLESSQ